MRKELERLSRSRSVAVRLAERSRIVLLAAGGLDNQEIAAKLDITRPGRWRDLSEDSGDEKDASRSGRIPSIGRRKSEKTVPQRQLEPVLDGQFLGRIGGLWRGTHLCPRGSRIRTLRSHWSCERRQAGPGHGTSDPLIQTKDHDPAAGLTEHRGTERADACAVVVNPTSTDQSSRA